MKKSTPPETSSYTEISIPGKKFDSKKLDWSLLPVECVEEIVKVLHFGARKYSRDNWKLVDSPEDRYYAAAMRHLVAWKKGHKRDKQSGKSHLAHAGCCLLFLQYFDREARRKSSTQK